MQQCYAHYCQWKPWRRHILGSSCCFSWLCCARWSNSLSFLEKGKLHRYLGVKSLSCICEILFHKMCFSSLFNAFILERAYLLHSMLSSIFIWFNLLAFLKHMWKLPIFSFFLQLRKTNVGITFKSIPRAKCPLDIVGTCKCQQQLLFSSSVQRSLKWSLRCPGFPSF